LLDRIEVESDVRRVNLIENHIMRGPSACAKLWAYGTIALLKINYALRS